MEEKIIIDKLESNDISIEDALQLLYNNNYCPALLNDDNGRWAVSFRGKQSLIAGDTPADVECTYFIEAKFWKSTIKEALVFSLKED